MAPAAFSPCSGATLVLSLYSSSKEMVASPGISWSPVHGERLCAMMRSGVICACCLVSLKSSSATRNNVSGVCRASVGHVWKQVVLPCCWDAHTAHQLGRKALQHGIHTRNGKCAPDPRKSPENEHALDQCTV